MKDSHLTPRRIKPGNMPFKDEHQHLLTDPVFLIGNGASRTYFDLEQLRGKGTIIGCNALYRDFIPDLLVTIDAKMIKELQDAKYWEKGLLIVPANRTAGLGNSLKWKTDRFNTSGCFAMKLISEIMQPKKCYMIGMDAFPGNVYDRTHNYASNTLQNFTGVCSYYLQALKASPHTVFYNVNVKDAWPEEAAKTGRYVYMEFEDFKREVLDG